MNYTANVASFMTSLHSSNGHSTHTPSSPLCTSYSPNGAPHTYLPRLNLFLADANLMFCLFAKSSRVGLVRLGETSREDEQRSAESIYSINYNQPAWIPGLRHNKGKALALCSLTAKNVKDHKSRLLPLLTGLPYFKTTESIVCCH